VMVPEIYAKAPVHGMYAGVIILKVLKTFMQI